ncbi:MAG: winged helix DNA-binding protein [Alphaproteobacteria bacterium]|jgi:DNA-binding MarR family transcriptional regulator|nr:winged helix DNA-binding protein [Alphaproteobacteria bacterium]MBT5389843.1 winged helix DNA-binding protein [Alphaproteobacteria bacterium]MBT5540969.1 winged helix DNA-binding protein [Alphaproteobacteria bacterium]MBT5653994.1 winged helix DNA-binding protein [Alphaproteobacteria bacterium]
MKSIYFESIVLIEKLHRLFLEVVRAELERSKIYDINNVQSLILYNIGENQLTVGDLTSRGLYMGSNVTYNLKKLVENGYLHQEKSSHDRRSSQVRVTEKGRALCKKIAAVLDKQAKQLKKAGTTTENLQDATDYLKMLENFWASETRTPLF